MLNLSQQKSFIGEWCLLGSTHKKIVFYFSRLRFQMLLFPVILLVCFIFSVCPSFAQPSPSQNPPKAAYSDNKADQVLHSTGRVIPQLWRWNLAYRLVRIRVAD